MNSSPEAETTAGGEKGVEFDAVSVVCEAGEVGEKTREGEKVEEVEDTDLGRIGRDMGGERSNATLYTM